MAKTKEWTLMFYFASDNPLGPTIVSQLKALKQAGFHPDANVIAYYDPPVPGTPTHVFDVNITEKIKAEGGSKIGFKANDPLVRNLVEDKLWGDQKSIEGVKITDLIANCLGGYSEAYEPPNPSSFFKKKQRRKTNFDKKTDQADQTDATAKDDAESPETSLGSFLKFCSAKYPARNYMLFILGHGLVVGNDVFLYDDSATVHSLSLKTLGEILGQFKVDIQKSVPGAEFQLVSFHSCSMSSLEVAYELKETANYMLAAQCPTSVGSWPYRQILIRILNDLKNGMRNVRTTLEKIYYYCIYNSYDFELAGYSLDLCLCDLRNTSEVKKNLGILSKKLIAGFADGADPTAADMILLAHWDAQSYWGEMYTDLYDFCACLEERCTNFLKRNSNDKGDNVLSDLVLACQGMKTALEPQSRKSPNQLIAYATFVGPAYQYAHGLSVYFPWSEPFRSQFWGRQYAQYKLIGDENLPADQKAKRETLKQLIKKENPSWRDFLRVYFNQTMRKTRYDEDLADGNASADDRKGQTQGYRRQIANTALEAMAVSAFSSGELGGIGLGEWLGPGEGKAGGGDATGMPDPGKVGGGDGTGDPGKVGGGDGTGGDFYFSTIKNYPPYTRAREARPKRTSAKPKQ